MAENFWVISEVFFPDEVATAHILTKITNKIKCKYCVNVIASSNYYRIANRNVKTPDLEKINIIRVNIPNILRSNTKYLRLICSIYISLSLVIRLIAKVKKNEKVLIVTNPLFLVLFISFLKLFKKFNLIILVHDVFPENTIPAKILNSQGIIYKLLKKIFDKAYSKADKLIVIGHDMKQVIDNKVKSNKSIVIENWVDDEFVESPLKIKDHHNGPIKFIYAGNIGRVQGILTLTKAFFNSQFKNAELEIWGNGYETSQIQKFIIQNRCVNISYCGQFTRNNQKEINSNIDIIIISLVPGMYGLGVPSKFYNSLALGKPILYIGDKNSEIERLITKYNIGFFVNSKNIEIELPIIANEILNLDKSELIQMGINAKSIALNLFSEEIILSKYEQLL